MPRRIMGRDRLVAAATRVMPPRPKDSASLAAQHRHAFSWRCGAKASYFCRTLETINDCAIMAVYSDRAFWNSYFGPAPLGPPRDLLGDRREYRLTDE